MSAGPRAPAALPLHHLDRESEAVRARVASAAGSSASAGVWTKLIRTMPRGVPPSAPSSAMIAVLRPADAAQSASRRPAGVSATLRPTFAQQLHPDLALELGQLHRHRGRA